jgi:hypothetical protein
VQPVANFDPFRLTILRKALATERLGTVRDDRHESLQETQNRANISLDKPPVDVG